VEGVPGVLIEAMMSGCPIVTVPVGGVQTAVVDGETGLVARQAGADELAALVVALLHDPQRARDLGTRARAAAIAGFSSAEAGRTYAARLTDLLTGRAAT
jgi:glycosyltransferase involved in cell wall biosynthesis